jgi:hypothetical protein
MSGGFLFSGGLAVTFPMVDGHVVGGVPFSDIPMNFSSHFFKHQINGDESYLMPGKTRRILRIFFCTWV